MTWDEFDEQLRWQGQGASIVSGEEIRRNGGSSGDAIRGASSFVRKGLVLGLTVCLFVNGVPKPGWGFDRVRRDGPALGRVVRRSGAFGRTPVRRGRRPAPVQDHERDPAADRGRDEDRDVDDQRRARTTAREGSRSPARPRPRRTRTCRGSTARPARPPRARRPRRSAPPGRSTAGARSTGRPPRSRGSRRTTRPRCRRSASTSVRGRPATANPSWSRRPRSWIRGQRSTRERSRSAPGRRWATIPIARTTTNRPATAAPTRTALETTPRTLRTSSDTDAIATTDDEVDDALDDDRPERRRPADALPVAEVVAPDELAEPGRQDVVRQVADEQVAEHVAGTRTAWIGRTRRCQRSAAHPEIDAITEREPDRDPARVGGAEDVGRLLEVDAAEDEDERDERDRGPDERLAGRVRAARVGRRSPAQPAGRRGPAVRAVSFGRAADADAGGACSGGRPGASTGRRRRCAGTRPSWPRRNSASARRSRRSGGPSRPRRPGRSAPGRTRSRCC